MKNKQKDCWLGIWRPKWDRGDINLATQYVWMKSTKKTWSEKRNETQEVYDRKQIDGCLRLEGKSTKRTAKGSQLPASVGSLGVMNTGSVIVIHCSPLWVHWNDYTFNKWTMQCANWVSANQFLKKQVGRESVFEQRVQGEKRWGKKSLKGLSKNKGRSCKKKRVTNSVKY